MVRRLRSSFCILSVLVVFFFASIVFAELAVPMSCLPETLSLQAFESISASGNSRSFPLKSEKFGQIKDSGAQVRIDQDIQSGRLDVEFSFQAEDGISLPFNVYALLIVTSDGEKEFRDFTSHCTDPGIGFYPGQKVKLDPIFLKLREEQTYHLMIWGRM